MNSKIERQAISFLKHFMIKRGKMLNELPEFCSELFDEMLKDYPHLNCYLKSYYKEAKENSLEKFNEKHRRFMKYEK